jgi:hypothetical protein
MKITDVILKEDTDDEKYIRQHLAAMAKDAHKKDYWGVNEILCHVLNYYGDPDQEIMRQSQNLDLLNTYKAAIIKSLLIVIKMPEDEFDEYEYDFNNVINFLKSNLKWPEIDVIIKAMAYDQEKKSVNESEESDELVGEFLGYIDQKNYWEAFNSLIGAYDTNADCLQSWWASFDEMKPEIMKGLLYVIKNESDLPLENIIADMYADLKWPELLIVQKALMHNKQQKSVPEAIDPDSDPMISYVQTMYDDLVGGSTELTVLNLRDYIYDTGSAENLARAIQEIKPELVDLIQKNKHGMIKSMLEIIKRNYDNASKNLLPVLEVLHHLGIDWPESDRIAVALTQGKSNKQASESELTETLKTDGYGGWISPAGKVDYVGEHEHEDWMADNNGLSYDQAFEQNWVRFATQDTNDLYLQGKLSALKKVYSRYAGNIARTQSIFVDIVNPAGLGPQYKETWDAFHFWSNPKDKNRFMKMFSPEPAQAAMAESQTEQIPAAEILKYVKQIHPEGEFNIDHVITDHPFWTEADVPVSSLHIFDPEKDDIYDPYNRVQDTDLYHVDRLIPNIAAILQNKPLVIDDAGYILDGNHRALAAEKAGLQTVPVWQPVKGQQGVAEDITVTDASRYVQGIEKRLNNNIRNLFTCVIELNSEQRMSDPEFRSQVLAVFDKHKPEIMYYMLRNIKHSDSDNVKWLAPGMIKIGIDWPELKTISQALNVKKPDRAVSENDYRFSDVHQKKAEKDASRMNNSLERLGKHIAAGGKITVREITSFWDVIYDINVFSKYRLAILQPVLEHHKKTIVYMMLYILKHHHDDINEPMPEIFTSLRHAQINWPELKTIQQALAQGKKKESVEEEYGSAMTLQALRTRMNKLMNDDQKYTDPTQRTNWQDGVWRFINSNQAAIFADKGNKGNGDYPAAPYAAWLLVQHMDAHPERQSQFYMKLRKAFPNHPKLQFLKDRSAVNAWILKNANSPEYYHNGKPLPDPTVNVRNPAMFKDASVKAASREEALTNAEQAGNKLLVAAVKATNAQTQPSYTQQNESVEEADDYGKFKTISGMIARDFAEHPVRGFYMMLYHLNELELSVADMPEIKPQIDKAKPLVIRALLESIRADNDGMNISNALQILDRMQKCGVNWPEIDKIRQGLQHGRNTESVTEASDDNTFELLQKKLATIGRKFNKYDEDKEEWISNGFPTIKGVVFNLHNEHTDISFLLFEYNIKSVSEYSRAVDFKPKAFLRLPKKTLETYADPRGVIHVLLHILKRHSNNTILMKQMQKDVNKLKSKYDWPELDVILKALNYQLGQGKPAVATEARNASQDPLGVWVRALENDIQTKLYWHIAITLEELSMHLNDGSFKVTGQQWAQAAEQLGLNAHKDIIIKSILENLRDNIHSGNSSDWLQRSISTQRIILQKLGCNWPEMDRIAAAVGH